MERNENLQKVYTALKNEGYTDIGDFNSFSSMMSDSNNVRKVYDGLLVSGYTDLGDFDTFKRNVYQSSVSLGDYRKVAEETYDAQEPKLEDGNRFGILGKMGKYMGSPSAYVPTPQVVEKKEPTPEELKQMQDAAKYREDLRTELQDSGAIDSMKDAKNEARRSKFKALGEMLAYTPQTSMAGISSSTFSEPDVTKAVEAGREFTQNKLMESTLNEALDMARQGEKNLDGSYAIGDFARGVWDEAVDISTWDMGYSDLVNAATLNQLVQKYESDRDNLTATEKKVLEALGMSAAVQEAYSGTTGIGYAVGQSIPHSAAFIGQMALNPAKGAGEALAKAAIKKVGKQGVMSTVGKVGTRLLTEALETGVMTATTGAGRVAADALERINGRTEYTIDNDGYIVYGGQTDNEAVRNAWWKAFGATFIEGYTESLGRAVFDPALDALKSVVGGKLKKGSLNKLGEIMLGEEPSRLAEAMRVLKSAGKVDSMVGELLEEEVGMIINALTVGDQSFDHEDPNFVFNLENQLSTLISTALMTGTINAAEAAGDYFTRRDINKKANDAEKVCRALYGEGWDAMRDKMDSSTPEEAVQMLSGIMQDPTIEQRKKTAMLEYASKRITAQYFNAEDEKVRESLVKEKRELHDAFNAGLEARLPDFYNMRKAVDGAKAALDEYGEKNNRMEEINAAIRGINESPERMNEILSGMSEEEQNLIRDYVYSRTRMNGAYVGRSNKLEDYVDEFAFAMEPFVVTNENGDRTITTANLDRVSGSIPVYVMSNDGTNAWVMREDGSSNMVLTKELENIFTKNAEDVIEAFRQQATETMDTETENAVKHHPKTQSPRVGLVLTNTDGTQMVVTEMVEGGVKIAPAVFKDGQYLPKGGAATQTITTDQAYGWQDTYNQKQDEKTSFKIGTEQTFYLKGKAVKGVITGIGPDGNYNVDIEEDVEGYDKVGSYTLSQMREMTTPPAKTNNLSANQPQNEGTPSERIEQSVSGDLTNGQIGFVGRVMTSEEANAFIPQMVQMAEPAVELDFTPENWVAEFGEDGMVPTPMGNVKMGENQYFKLSQKKRTAYFGMVKPTLINPDIILEEYDPKDGAERDTKLIFVKTFIKPDGSRTVNFESVTVKKGDLEVSISSHEVDNEQLLKKVQQDKLLHLNEKFSSSELRLTEPQQEGSDLVPSPNSISSNTKISGNVSNVQGNGQENNLNSSNLDAGQNIVAPIVYEQVDADTAWDDIVAKSKGNIEVAQEVANEMLANKKKALASAKKSKPKSGNTVDEILANKEANAMKIAQAEADVKAWEAISSVNARRMEEARTEAEVLADELAKEKTIADGVDKLGAPQSLHEYVLMTLAGGGYKIKWDDKANGTKGFGAHTGLSTKEMQKRLAMVDNTNGYTPEELAHDIVENMSGNFGEVDVMDVTDMVIDIVASNSSRGDMFNSLVHAREEAIRQREADEQQQKDAWYMERYHATEEELAAYNEWLNEDAQEFLADEGEYERRIINFAEQLADYDNEGTDASLLRAAAQREGNGPVAEGSSSVGEAERTDNSGEVLGNVEGAAAEDDGAVDEGVLAQSDVNLTRETLENGDVRITNRNTNGEVATIALERDGNVISVDTYEDGALFERTDYDANGNATKVTRYKDGEVVSEQEYKDGKRKVTANYFEMAEEVQKKRKPKKKNDKLAEKNHQQKENRSETRGVGNRPQLQDASSYESFVERVSEYPQRSYKGTGKSRPSGTFSISYYTQFLKELFQNAHWEERPIEEVAGIIRRHNAGKTLLARTEDERELISALRALTNNEIQGELSNINNALQSDKYTDEEKEELKRAKNLITRFVNRGERNAVIEALTGAKLGEKLPLSKIDELFEMYNSDANVAELYGRVRAIAEQIGLDFWFEEMEDRLLGGYLHSDNRVRLNAHMLYCPRMQRQGVASTIVHEMLHAVAGYAVYTQKDIKLGLTPKVQLSKQVLSAANAIINIYEKAVKDNPALVHQEYDIEKEEWVEVADYGTTSVHEMLSEISNPEFRDKLKQIGYNGRSVWQRIWDAIKSMFTQSSDVANPTAYDSMAKALDVLINEFSMDAYQKYSGLEESAMKLSAEENLRFRDGDNAELKEKYTDEQIFDAAKQKFGVTDDIREAGYILPDGSMLDFSGRYAVDGDASYLKGGRHMDHREVNQIAYDANDNETGLETNMTDFIERGAIRIHYSASGVGIINLDTAPTKEQKAKLRQLISAHNGNMDVDFGNGWSTEHHAEYDKAKPTRILGDIDRYYSEGVRPEGNILYRDGAPFFSNAERAVENIKQQKATPEQWLAMIKKDGGLKAGEDKWMGLSDWLNEQKEKGVKTLTKDEVLQFIRENQIEIEEVEYGNNPVGFDELKEEYEAMLRDEGYDAAHDAMTDRYGDDFDIAFEDLGGELAIANEEAAATLLGSGNIINSTRLEYTTEGLDNKREIALVVPTIEPWNQSDTIHFGDAGEGRAVAWVRFGETTDEDGNRVLVIDEVQSKRHDEGRAKGYKSEARLKELEREYENIMDEHAALTKEILHDAGYAYKGESEGVYDEDMQVKDEIGLLGSDEQLARRNELSKRLADVANEHGNLRNGIPDAPFDKNYHELAMKRMLRYAAENGFDKVAWNTGKQVAKRFGISQAVSSIEYSPLSNGHYKVIAYGALGYPLENVPTVYNSEQEIAETFGRGIASKIVNDIEENKKAEEKYNAELKELKERRKGIDEESEEYEQILEEAGKLLSLRDATREAKSIEGEGLSIGGEDRVALYDEMIPRFMNKYTKKWGTKVGEVTLPEVEEAGRTMWSVDVTPEMRESVMQGQPMFREGMGAISDREVSYENDPIAKWQGKPRYYGKRAAAFAERERARMQKGVEEAAKILGIEAEIITDASTLKGRKAKAKGWYDIINKKVVVVVPNHVSMGDAVRTVLHEGVAHHGLRELFGDGFDAMLDNVYNNVAPELKARIDAIAERTGVSTNVATEEYLASLAETTNFEEAKNNGWWAKIKQYFVKMLNKLGMPGLNLKEELTDNELRYLLWRSYQNLVDPNSYLKPLGYLDDVAKQKELKVGNYAENTMATPMVAEMSEAEEWSAITMQRIEELEAQAAQLENEIADMEADRDADDASRYDIWEQQIDQLREQLEDVYAEIEGLYTLSGEEEVNEEEREAEKQRQLYQKRIDNAYLKAVREGNWEEATDLFRQYVLSKAEDEGIVPMDYGVGYKGGAHSSIAKKVKEENPDAIAEAAYQMSIRIPKGSILVPMPSRTGNATYTVKLAEAIAKATDSEVRDVLKGKARMSVYEAKQKGIKMTPEDLGMYTTEELPKGKNIVIIDNVIDKGTTALAAVSAVKGASVVAYAYTLGDKQRAATLKLAEPVTYDDNKRIIPLSQRFNKDSDDIRYRMSINEEEFDNTQREAVRNIGIVMPNLGDAEVNIVDVPRHDFTGTGNEAISKAKEWANRELIGEHVANEGTKEEFKYSIDEKSVKKFLSGVSTSLSDNLGVHLSVLKKLPSVIDSSIEAEIHADYKKGEQRDASNGIEDENLLIHRLYGCAKINGELYRVKTTIKERKSAGVKPYTYEVTKIELLDGSSQEGTSSSDASSNSISGAKLLKGVEKSYDKGKLLLDESKRVSENSINSEEIISEVERESAALGVPVRIVRSVDELPDEDTRKRAVDGQLKGYFDPRTGEVVVYEPNTDNANDAKRTVLHEIVGHKGLRQLLGDKNFDKTMMQMYRMLPETERKKVWDAAMTKYGDLAEAMEEYLAEKAELAKKPSFLQRLWMFLKGVFKRTWDAELTDADINYLLWRSRKKLEADTPMDMAVSKMLKQAAQQSELTEEEVNQLNEARERLFDKSRNADYLRKRTGDAQREYEDAVNTLAYKSQEAFQDSMLALRTLQEAVAKESGKEIRDWENPYMAENRMSSINLRDHESYKKNFYKKLLMAVSDIMDMGVEYDAILNYMMAKHGLERNEVFALRDAVNYAEGDTDKQQELYEKNRKTDYAGLTALTGMSNVEDAEAEAQRMVDEFEQKVPKHLVDELWRRNKACNQRTLDITYNAGIMDLETYNKLSNQFQYYIPLQGFDETTAEEVYFYIGGKDSPYNAPIKAARGRKSRADDPIATIGSVAESAIVDANRNKMKQEFYAMAVNHKTSLISVSDVWMAYDPASDSWVAQFPTIPNDATPSQVKSILDAFEVRMEAAAAANPDLYAKASEKPNVPYRVVKKADMNEHQVIVKRNGRDVVMTINGNPRAAQAINGLTNPEANKNLVNDIANWINRNLSANFTTRNPAFVVSNFVRDSIYTNSMVWVKESPMYAKKYHKNFAKATTNITSLVNKYKRYEEGDKNALDMNDPLQKMFYEFMSNGGETGYTAMHSVDDYKRMSQKELKKLLSKGAMSNAQKVVDVLAEGLDTFGRWAEDTSRFAAYMTSREMGRTVARSIYDAKEISVNFNKKGAGSRMRGKFKDDPMAFIAATISQMGRNCYVFWNAGVQGLTNFGRAAKENKGKFTVMAMAAMAAGMLIPVLFSSDDDEDDEYYLLPEYVRRNNICIKVGKNKFITLPLPIEIRALYGMGELAYSYLSGKEEMTTGEATKKVIQQISQVMPIDMMADGGGAMALVPSAVKPVVEAIENKNWTGDPIYRKETVFNENDPTWMLAYKSTSPELIWLSRQISEATNENTHSGEERKYDRGWADNRFFNNPAVWEHIFEGYLGGIATITNQTKKTIMMPFNEDLQDLRNVPIASRFVKSAGESTKEYKLVDEYYGALDIMDELSDELSSLKKDMRDASKKLDSAKTELEKAKAQREYDNVSKVYNEMNTDAYGVVMTTKKLNASIKKIEDLHKTNPDEKIPFNGEMMLPKDAINKLRKEVIDNVSNYMNN